MSKIHTQLDDDCIVLGSFPLSWLLLSRDSLYPWFILVPDRNNITEMYQLSVPDQQQLMLESCYLAKMLAASFNADKMNVAALGNVVPQLHIHHIVRYEEDIAWPAPVWGYAQTKPYSAQQLEKMSHKINNLKLLDFDYSARP